jgi:hypothetical protein
MKSKHLVRYDYGQGALWAFIHGDSPLQIMERYPELEVVEEIPPWFTAEISSLVEARETYDVDAPPSGLLSDLIEQRARSVR